MNVVVSSEQRFDRTPDGAVWTQAQSAYSFWTRYLAVFDHICVVARVQEVSTLPPGWRRVDGEGVSFATIPHYLGPWQYFIRMHQVQGVAQNVVGSNDAVIFRVPS